LSFNKSPIFVEVVIKTCNFCSDLNNYFNQNNFLGANSSSQQQSNNQFSYRSTKVQKTITSAADLTTPPKNENWSPLLTQVSLLPYNATTNTSIQFINKYPTTVHRPSAVSSISLPASPLIADPKTPATSNCLPSDRSNKCVQEWLITNRFGHLVPIFLNYTSNDILRLTKEDMVSLCGAPDGIRCFNMAHNIQLRPKLTLFVKFKERTAGFYSPVFIGERKAEVLVQRLLKTYRCVEADTESAESKCEFELFVKLKDMLVKATDELVDNLEDQSRYFVEMEKTCEILVKVIMHPIE